MRVEEVQVDWSPELRAQSLESYSGARSAYVAGDS
jgi:hypothetical protein